MLQRRENGTLVEIARPLDAAVAYAWENNEFIDGIKQLTVSFSLRIRSFV